MIDRDAMTKAVARAIPLLLAGGLAIAAVLAPTHESTMRGLAVAAVLLLWYILGQLQGIRHGMLAMRLEARLGQSGLDAHLTAMRGPRDLVVNLPSEADADALVDLLGNLGDQRR